MNAKSKTIILLIVLCLVDIVIPIPIIGIILIYVVFQQPSWFKDMFNDIYNITGA